MAALVQFPTRAKRAHTANVDEFVFQRPFGVTPDDMGRELDRLQMIAQATAAYVRTVGHLAAGLDVATKSRPDLSSTLKVIAETVADDLRLTPEAAAVLSGMLEAG